MEVAWIMSTQINSLFAPEYLALSLMPDRKIPSLCYAQIARGTVQWSVS